MTNPLSKEEFVAEMQERRAEREAPEPPKSGHNSNQQLKSYVERLVNLKEEKARIGEDIGELKKEAKGNGFDPRALEAIAKREMEDDDARAKREALAEVVDTYASALGMVL
jgi:uncharacterized protein (UPF0335 family)